MNKTHIINKLIEHYKFETNADFAKFLGIKPQVLSNWKSRNTFDIELVFNKCPEINPEWLITGKGPKKKMTSKIVEVEPEVKSKEQNKIPFLPLSQCLNKDADLLKDTQKTFVSLPGITDGDGATQVETDNMEPVLEIGDYVVYQNVPVDVKQIEYKKMYILSIYIDAKKTYQTIRYVYKSDLGSGYVKLVNEDKQYLDRNIEVSKIAALGCIKNVVKIT
ncbi:helix-turn-helix domain containing protein [Flavobacterium agricola]|uniref:Helix-turn-helix domain containing protein n=1 Tax=Flavobacterium agricola TaxID=2870839 RepID=A0ABY6LZV4_9FLAO|nr:helix-turn-helix domain containing protein [Flavobacterium agricola]UYW00448.1 helix-turn-helix domain containing protein [Flavobacterium agricola]